MKIGLEHNLKDGFDAYSPAIFETSIASGFALVLLAGRCDGSALRQAEENEEVDGGGSPLDGLLDTLYEKRFADIPFDVW